MCIGVPMQVLRCEGERALCAEGEQEVWVDISLVGEQEPHTWLLTFLGAAREVLDPLQAQQMINALTAVEAIMSGQKADIDTLFADLAEREPQLPPHLQPDTNN